MHWGGAIFSIIMGVFSDVVFRGKRWQVVSLGFFFSGIALLFIYIYKVRIINSFLGTNLLVLFLFIAGGCIQGVQAPIINLPGDILGVRLGGNRCWHYKWLVVYRCITIRD